MIMSRRPAEFDAFAAGYDAGMSDPVKRLVGESAEIFMAHKADWLVRNGPAVGRLLDFGCGTGTFLRALRRSGRPLELTGCDVAASMIDTARREWNAGPEPDLHVLEPGPLPFGDAAFDVVTVSAVLHHVERTARPAIVRELLRVVRPGGTIVVFEHNPWNPLTRWIVARAPIDANARLLSAAECTALLYDCGVTRSDTSYILFVPPRFRRLWPMERVLASIPLGGQYVVRGIR
jgi:SAM-dependent methyltransferase